MTQPDYQEGYKASYQGSLAICNRHAARLLWAMETMSDKLPLTAAKLNGLSSMDIAVLDQFGTRFAKLQDMMGAKLFPSILELTKEQGELLTFVDKLNRLEKIGAIESSDQWLLLREVRNQFSHDYPDDSEIQAAILNKAFELAKNLLQVLDKVKSFASAYVE